MMITVMTFLLSPNTNMLPFSIGVLTCSNYVLCLDVTLTILITLK